MGVSFPSKSKVEQEYKMALKMSRCQVGCETYDFGIDTRRNFAVISFEYYPGNLGDQLKMRNFNMETLPDITAQISTLIDKMVACKSDPKVIIFFFYKKKINTFKTGILLHGFETRKCSVQSV